eukprot:scaffold100330_cov45-Phaeocystis_antarctica.AAC.2
MHSSSSGCRLRRRPRPSPRAVARGYRVAGAGAASQVEGITAAARRRARRQATKLASLSRVVTHHGTAGDPPHRQTSEYCNPRGDNLPRG